MPVPPATNRNWVSGGSGRQDERAERPIHGHARTTPQPAQVRSPSLRLELQQELQVAVCGRLTGRRGNRVGHALRLSAEAEQGCLAGLVAERTAAERQPDNARGRRRAPDAGDLKIAGGQNVEMLLLDRGSAVRRVGGSAGRRGPLDRWSARPPVGQSALTGGSADRRPADRRPADRRLDDSARGPLDVDIREPGRRCRHVWLC